MQLTARIPVCSHRQHYCVNQIVVFVSVAVTGRLRPKAIEGVEDYDLVTSHCKSLVLSPTFSEYDVIQTTSLFWMRIPFHERHLQFPPL